MPTLTHSKIIKQSKKTNVPNYKSAINYDLEIINFICIYSCTLCSSFWTWNKTSVISLANLQIFYIANKVNTLYNWSLNKFMKYYRYLNFLTSHNTFSLLQYPTLLLNISTETTFQ